MFYNQDTIIYICVVSDVYAGHGLHLNSWGRNNWGANGFFSAKSFTKGVSTDSVGKDKYNRYILATDEYTVLA